MLNLLLATVAAVSVHVSPPVSVHVAPVETVHVAPVAVHETPATMPRAVPVPMVIHPAPVIAGNASNGQDVTPATDERARRAACYLLMGICVCLMAAFIALAIAFIRWVLR